MTRPEKKVLITDFEIYMVHISAIVHAIERLFTEEVITAAMKKH